METKDLNKPQLILLALLISFVTSIATGIATVTLLDQAPPPVTQTINRVVLKTIETVAPDTVKTKVQTIIIKEQDLIVDAIAKNIGNLVTIKKGEEEIGQGFLVSKDGLILTDARFASAEDDYSVVFGEATLKALYISSDPAGFSILKAILEDKEKSFTFSLLGDSSALKVGQVALALGGDQSIVQGIITGSSDKKIIISPAIPSDEPGGPAEEKSITVKLINLSANISKIFAGGPVVDIDGNVIGLVLAREGETIVLPIGLAKDAIMELGQKISLGLTLILNIV